MPSQERSAEPTLYAELIRRGLPADYARRTAEELDDHRADLLTELRDDEAVNERLGTPRALAKKIAHDYRRRSWFGRHPLVTFVVAPIPLWIATGVAFYLTLAAALYPLDGMINGAIDNLAPWTRLIVATSFALAIHILLFAIIPSWLSHRLTRLALKATQQRSWAIVASCLIGFAAASLTYKLRLSTTPGESFFFLQTPPFSEEEFRLLTPLQHYLRPLALAQLSGPLLAAFVILYRDEQTRRRALLAAPACEAPVRLAA